MTSHITERIPVAVGALGGTIGMSADHNSKQGAVPSLDAEALIDIVPNLRNKVDLRVKTINSMASASLSYDILLEALAFAQQQAEIGVSGIVLTHGTDTLEESAYFLDLLWNRPEPLVITGAMNTESEITADGPQNIADSVLAATSNFTRALGVIVCFAGEIHLAHTVAKMNSSCLSPFKSPDWGPVGRIVEHRVHAASKPVHRRMNLAIPHQAMHSNIPIIETGLNDDGSIIDIIAQSHPDAIVLAASGAGHISEMDADAAQRAVKSGITVVFTTHTGSGSTYRRTYGYRGGEMDLIRRGLIPAGFLTARKARVLLALLHANNASMHTKKLVFQHEGEW